MSEEAYGVLKLPEELAQRTDGAGEAVVDRVRDREDGGRWYGDGGSGAADGESGYHDGGADAASSDPLAALALAIDGIYGSDQRAPAGWHRKDQLRKELRRTVRHEAHQAGMGNIGEVASRVEHHRVPGPAKRAGRA